MILGTEGSAYIVLPFSTISALACSVSPGVKFGIFPRGTLRLEAVSRILWKIFSPVEHEVGCWMLLKGFPVSVANDVQFAFLLLV